MAYLVKIAENLDDPPKSKQHDLERKKSIKKRRSITTSGVRAIYAFLEGYLNCLAYDILYDDDGHTNKQIDKLIDKSHLSLRSKVLQYTKIALNRKHPPIKESNCPQLDVIIGYNKIIRNSLIHPRPHRTIRSPKSFFSEKVNNKIEENTPDEIDLSEPLEGKMREVQYLKLEVDDLVLLCEAAIDLVRRIEEELDYQYTGAKHWLHDRKEDGFSDEVFF